MPKSNMEKPSAKSKLLASPFEIGHYFTLDTYPNSAYINTKSMGEKSSFDKIKF
jgi:hypothetical protein